jgi:RNA polymerase sigma-70 factor (ECF subfamily)
MASRADGMADQDLAKILEKCRAAWPGVTVTADVFAAHVAQVAPKQSLAQLRAEDLYLACACAQKDPKAIAAFEEKYLHEVSSYIGQIDRSPSFVDEVSQTLREKLFVAEGSKGTRPKICDYTGKGPLGAWLRVVCVRIALNMRRRPKHTVEAEGENAPVLRSPSLDPEMDYLKTRYKTEFREAFQTTLAALSSDERNVLKMHYIDGLNIDEIGKAYHVHRATVARWLASAREKIMDETKKRLTERLKIGGAEVESILGLVRSQLDVSIYKFLKD